MCIPGHKKMPSGKKHKLQRPAKELSLNIQTRDVILSVQCEHKCCDQAARILKII